MSKQEVREPEKEAANIPADIHTTEAANELAQLAELQTEAANALNRLVEALEKKHYKIYSVLHLLTYAIKANNSIENGLRFAPTDLIEYEHLRSGYGKEEEADQRPEASEPGKTEKQSDQKPKNISNPKHPARIVTGKQDEE